MLSFFTPQGRVLIKSTLLKNRGVQLFLIPKVLFIFLALVGSFFGLLGLAGAIWLVAEIGVALTRIRTDIAEGFTTTRSRQIAFSRLTLSLLWGGLAWALFSLIWFWLALPLALLTLVFAVIAYVLLAIRRIIADLVGIAPVKDAALFERVRQMRDLDADVTLLETRLLQSRDFDQRRDLTYYLAWAQTFRGHRLLPAGLWKEAITYYKTALAIDPSNMAARVSLALCYLKLNDFELALNETRRGISIFNGKQSRPKYDTALWHWHRNEVSSEYEQSAGLFQLCALGTATVQNANDLSGASREFFTKEFTDAALLIPDRSEAELMRLLARKAGYPLGALHVLTAGLFRAPAEPLALLEDLVTLPLTRMQIVEDAA
jgi:tetratricopeptide (TPR) repeat protein